jgi:hypothetical protein
MKAAIPTIIALALAACAAPSCPCADLQALDDADVPGVYTGHALVTEWPRCRLALRADGTGDVAWASAAGEPWHDTLPLTWHAPAQERGDRNLEAHAASGDGECSGWLRKTNDTVSIGFLSVDAPGFPTGITFEMLRQTN